jgi:preprotein translocase subunit SecF
MAKQNSITHRLYTGQISYDFMKNRKIWYTFTGIILLICIGATLIKGLSFGIEFSGGVEFSVPVTVSEDKLPEYKDAVVQVGLEDMDDLTITQTATAVLVKTRTLTEEETGKVKEALAATAGDDADEVTYRSVSGSWGQQITQQGLIALVVFLVLVSVLITAYFRDWKMAVAAILALMHDLLVTLGVYAIVAWSFTPSTLIGMLTILGYSLYDTVVVFDKVRENVADIFNGKETYSTLANRAINQVLVRSINTTIIGVLPVAALTFAGAFILGTGPLKDLGLALLVGMIAGTYSSIFIATPLLAQMREREPAMAEHRKRLVKRAQRQSWRKDESAEPVSVAAAAPPKAIEITEDEDAASELAVVSAEQANFNRRQPTRSSRSKRKK